MISLARTFLLYYAGLSILLGGSFPESAHAATVSFIDHPASVAFTSQAPRGNWRDPREQNGCEEASALMAMAWVNGKWRFSTSEAERDILAIADFEKKTYGSFVDTNVHDTVERIFKGYFHYSNVEVRENITTADIKAELAKGHIVIVPVNGRKLANPYYTAPGPLEHNLLIRGFDTASGEFITNDPGTKRGRGYRYKERLLQAALRDYPTGDAHQEVKEIKRSMIVVFPRTK